MSYQGFRGRRGSGGGVEGEEVQGEEGSRRQGEGVGYHRGSQGRGGSVRIRGGSVRIRGGSLIVVRPWAYRVWGCLWLGPGPTRFGAVALVSSAASCCRSEMYTRHPLELKVPIDDDNESGGALTRELSRPTRPNPPAVVATREVCPGHTRDLADNGQRVRGTRSHARLHQVGATRGAAQGGQAGERGGCGLDSSRVGVDQALEWEWGQ